MAHKGRGRRREGEDKGNIVNSGDKAKLISLLGTHDASERQTRNQRDETEHLEIKAI